eukprot:3616931-Rhodomonas_salina.1
MHVRRAMQSDRLPLSGEVFLSFFSRIVSRSAVQRGLFVPQTSLEKNRAKTNQSRPPAAATRVKTSELREEGSLGVADELEHFQRRESGGGAGKDMYGQTKTESGKPEQRKSERHIQEESRLVSAPRSRSSCPPAQSPPPAHSRAEPLSPHPSHFLPSALGRSDHRS